MLIRPVKGVYVVAKYRDENRRVREPVKSKISSETGPPTTQENIAMRESERGAVASGPTV
jgi:hypothetical protein